MHNSTNSTTLHNFASGKVAFTIYILNNGAKVLIKFHFQCTTVSDWVPKKDSANFESDAFL